MEQQQYRCGDRHQRLYLWRFPRYSGDYGHIGFPVQDLHGHCDGGGAVRTAYASPNIAGVGSAVTFTAITDTTRDGVRFTVQFPSGTTQMISATSSTTETTGQTSTKVWKAAMNLTEQGTYRVDGQLFAGRRLQRGEL